MTMMVMITLLLGYKEAGAASIRSQEVTAERVEDGTADER